jgi:prepilin-type processing-associated H-X9-DG protein
MNRIASLVVVCLLGLVILGLGIPALVRWRTYAERTRCMEHLRFTAVRISDYSQREKAFPPGTVPAKDLPPEKRLSWVVPGLLPEFDPKNVMRPDPTLPWDADANRGAGSIVFKALLCPALLHQSVDGRGLLDYPGIAGVGADAARLARSDPHAGIFAYDEATQVSAVKDGTANVLLLLETSRNIGPWIAGGPTSVRGVDPKDQPYLGEGRPFGGNHRGGVNAAFADGHGQFLSDKINATVLEMLAAMADGQAAPGP